MVVVPFLRNNLSAVMFFQRFIFCAKILREKYSERIWVFHCRYSMRKTIQGYRSCTSVLDVCQGKTWLAYLLSYTVPVEKLWTQNTRIIHDVWRLLILSNEEKRMIMKILKKEWLWKFWKKGGRGSREKGEEETKSMPHAPVC